MKVYRLKPKANNRGLTKSSFVKDPAIESELLYFNSEKTLKFINEEKREIYAPLLIPNKEIFRKNINGEPAKVFFTAEDIKELHLNGCKNGYDSKVSLNHEDMNVEGVYCFEHWIIENPNNDKANELGFNEPKGTLIKGYKAENEEVWNKIKNKDLMGLSIEVITEDLEFIEINNNNKIEMKKDKKSILDYVKSLFNTELAKEYATGYFGESLDEGSIITDSEGNPMADATFEYEGKIYKTDSMGAISTIEDKKEESVEVEVEMGENKEKDKEVEMAETPVDDQPNELEILKSKIAELETENADLKAEISKSKEKVEKMQSEIAEAKKITPIVKEKSYDEMTNYERYLFNRGKL